MAREFKLPDIGEGLTEAEIVRWLVAEGEHVEADQPVVEVETDKAVVEIPSPYAGVVLKHGGKEGETIEVGHVLVVIGEPGDSSPTKPETDAAPKEASQPVAPELGQQTPPAAPIVGTLTEVAESLEAVPEPKVSQVTTVEALPVVRKLARENEIDLEEITGTGPQGRITRSDVEAAIEARSKPQPTPPAAREHETARAPEHGPGDRSRTMSRLRRTIAANMSRSWSEIPHVTTFDDVDATRLLEVRDALGERHETKIPIEALVIKAVIPALQRFPEFNATLEGDELTVHDTFDIGIAVDTPDGLLVAVLKEAASQDVLALSGEVHRLGEGARARSLSPDELTGQTFTVSNIGAVGGGHGTPIVPHGTTAILSVGRAREKVIVDHGDMVVAPVMPLSMSYDHRVVDGAQGRRFMALVMENLEEPALFLA